jgi:hypothetical protein
MNKQSVNDIQTPLAQTWNTSVPEFLRYALDSHEVQEVTEKLVETINQDPRELPKKRQVACPGAPYTR